MSKQQRLIFLAIAAVIAVVAVVVLSGGSGSDEEVAQPATQGQSTTEGTGNEASAPEDPGEIVTNTTETETTPAATPTPRPEPEIPVLRAGRVQEIEVEKGDRVRFAVRSDTADHVHVHGYDIFKDVPANKRVELSFEATIEGIFEIELEDSKQELAKLRVEP